MSPNPVPSCFSWISSDRRASATVPLAVDSLDHPFEHGVKEFPLPPDRGQRAAPSPSPARAPPFSRAAFHMIRSARSLRGIALWRVSGQLFAGGLRVAAGRAASGEPGSTSPQNSSERILLLARGSTSWPVLRRAGPVAVGTVRVKGGGLSGVQRLSIASDKSEVMGCPAAGNRRA